jgi:preprotein translocase subunit SecG
MVTFFILFLVIVCVLLVAIVLMQSSKGSGLVGPIAGTGVTTMFGARRASDFLSKATVVLAVVFMLFSLLVNIYISKSGGTTSKESILQRNQKELSPGAPPVQEAPTLPGNQQNQQPNQEQNNQENQQQNPAP